MTVERRDGVGAAAPTEGAVFGEWVRPHLAHIAHLVARMAPEAERDDLVQDVLLRAWARRHRYDPARGTPSTWLLAIAANVALKNRSARVTHILSTKQALLGAESQTAQRLDVERALSRLSRRQRLAIECRYFVDLGVTDIAAVMGCSEGTVKSTLADARARLRKLLEVVE